MHHTLAPSLDSIAKSLDSVGSLGEYGEPDPDPAKFTEDGSFIGQYMFWAAGVDTVLEARSDEFN